MHASVLCRCRGCDGADQAHNPTETARQDGRIPTIFITLPSSRQYRWIRSIDIIALWSLRVCAPGLLEERRAVSEDDDESLSEGTPPPVCCAAQTET